jgi:hypothetical protein
MGHYYEIHVTVEYTRKVERNLDNLKGLAKMDGFHMGDLLMMKTQDERSRKDAFFTGRSTAGWEHARSKTKTFCRRLQRHGYKVIRWKIEDTLDDSKIDDTMGLLG